MCRQQECQIPDWLEVLEGRCNAQFKECQAIICADNFLSPLRPCPAYMESCTSTAYLVCEIVKRARSGLEKIPNIANIDEYTFRYLLLSLDPLSNIIELELRHCTNLMSRMSCSNKAEYLRFLHSFNVNYDKLQAFQCFVPSCALTHE